MREGILLEIDETGAVTLLTIDLRKNQDAIPVLQELGFIEKQSFEERFKNALTIQEAQEKTFQHIRNMYQTQTRWG